MRVGKAAILICFVALVGLPLLLAPRRAAPPDADRLIIITPHNEQIRYEFSRAFEAWHAEQFGDRVHVVWSVPGGTSEILRMLRSQYAAAAAGGDPLGGTADLMWGGGSWVHEQLKQPPIPISAPVDFDDGWLGSVYGDNAIGDGRLFDPQRHWFGTALAAFGIVYNRDVLAELGVAEPRSWADLADPRLAGWVAMADPAHSGSITTLFETILRQRGWDEGWWILRRAGANARGFPASALKSPVEVSLGDAAAGLCIDFFGRYQAQAIKSAGGRQRIGYVDPAGETSIDADPISMLTGAPRPDLARRFIEFCLSDIGQALWQFPVEPAHADGLGPRRFELRRMPIARSMYERHLDRFVDRVDPYDLARAVGDTAPEVRQHIDVLFGAMVIDNHRRLQAAWRILNATDADDPRRRRMLELFDAMPEGWDKRGRRDLRRYFRDNYERILVLE
ncbi:MAG: ABC transporter substrate-binding protein [Planctomycetota bacterium]